MQNNLNASDSKIPEWFHELLVETSRRLNLKKAPDVVFSADAVSPAVFGIVRPALLLPEEYLSGLSREEAEHVLIHELCHLKRGDLLIHWLCLLIQIFYWFNPLLIWTRRQMRHVCEICCDLSVAEILREKTRYYRETLLKNARELFTESVEPSLGLLGVFEEPFRIVPRLRWLERETWGHRKRKIATALLTCLIMVIFVMPMSGLSQSEVGYSDYTQKMVSVSENRDVPISEEANAALLEAQHRFETNPEDFAAAREPLIEYMETHPVDSVPLVMYQMLGQLWYIDEKNDKGIEEAQKVYKAGHEAFLENDDILLNYAVTTYEMANESLDKDDMEAANELFVEAASLFENYYDLNENHEAKYLEYAAASYNAAGNLKEANRVSIRQQNISDEPIYPMEAEQAIPEKTKPVIQRFFDAYNAQDFKGMRKDFSERLLEGGSAERFEEQNKRNLSKYGKIVSWDYTGAVVDDERELLVVAVNYAKGDTTQYVFGFDKGQDGNKISSLFEGEVHLATDTKQAASDRLPTDRLSTGNGVYQMNEVDTPPRIISAFPPEYPADAKTNKIEGNVVVQFVVDTDGWAWEPEVVEADPESVFEQSALDAIIKYEFEPATKDGTSVPCMVKMPIAFTLENREQNNDVPASSKINSDVGTIYTINQVDTPPRVLRAFPPQYPYEAKKNKIEGRVVVRFLVDTDGNAREPEVVEFVPEEAAIFGDSAMETIIENYKFKPATLDSVDVPCIVKLPLVFEFN
jgi:TonB family protein